ncbi:MAG: lipoprotein-releasing ABC transporter permease subunit [Pseudomonadaceae bacterium]|nr:lipoprotein-releasing ABC transporter permease subunit [Pseudomonadaceae bacterium]
MFTPLIVQRYLGSRRGFTRVVTAFSVLGILLGVAALIMVLAVMGGFRQELMSRILNLTGHMTIEIADLTLPAAETLAERLREMDGVVSAAPYVNGQAMVANAGRSTGALIRGIPPTGLPAMLTEHLITAAPLESPAAFKLGENELLLGDTLARQLGVLPGQKVLLVSPEGARTIAGFIPRTRGFTVAGTFRVGMVQFDSGLVVGGIEDIQQFAGMRGRVSAVEVRLANPEDVEKLKPAVYEIASRFAPSPLDVSVTTWHDTNQDFFRALQVERVTMFIILSLIVLVAAFNVISGQMMLVNDKLADIAILRTMGATRADIRNIFFFNGMMLGGLGTLGGVVVGALGVVNMQRLVDGIQALTGVNLFPGDVYFLSELPSRLAWGDMTAVVGMALVLTILASLYPAMRAASFEPVELLRR